MARMEPTLGAVEMVEAYSPPVAVLSDEPGFSVQAPRVFDFSGRLSLSRYWVLHLLFCVYIPWGLLFFFYAGLRHNLYALAGASLAVLIPAALLQAGLLMRRARDIGIPAGWGLIALLVPLIGSLLWLFLGVLPGNKGTNHYGAANPPLALWARLLIPLLLLLGWGVAFWVLLSTPDLMLLLKSYF